MLPPPPPLPRGPSAGIREQQAWKGPRRIPCRASLSCGTLGFWCSEHPLLPGGHSRWRFEDGLSRASGRHSRGRHAGLRAPLWKLVCLLGRPYGTCLSSWGFTKVSLGVGRFVLILLGLRWFSGGTEKPLCDSISPVRFPGTNPSNTAQPPVSPHQCGRTVALPLPFPISSPSCATCSITSLTSSLVCQCALS